LKAFLTNFLETQAFSQFILDRIVRGMSIKIIIIIIGYMKL